MMGASPDAVSISFNNEAFLNCIGEYRNKLIPFYFCNPWDSTFEYQIIGSKFFGLKMAPTVHGNHFNDPQTIAYIKIAQQFQHPVYTHISHFRGQTIDDFIKLAKRFRKIKFILGHCGIGNLDFHSVDCLKPVPNAYLETSGGFFKVVDYAVKQLGAHRLLFGSEYPLQKQELEIQKIKLLDISEIDKMKILRLNAMFLLKGRTKSEQNTRESQFS